MWGRLAFYFPFLLWDLLLPLGLPLPQLGPQGGTNLETETQPLKLGTPTENLGAILSRFGLKPFLLNRIQKERKLTEMYLNTSIYELTENTEPDTV